MEDSKTVSKFSEADVLELLSLVDTANAYGVPWLVELIQAIQAPTERKRRNHIRKIEQAIALEATRIDNPHSRARRILAHIRVNTSPNVSDETNAALLIGAEIAAGDFRTLGFRPEPEILTTPNGEESERAIGFFIYDAEKTQTKARKKPKPAEPEDDE